jgi:hypothetical protein
MATTIKSSDLDFNTIKTRLKDYLKSKTEFADYDFEASGLSNILDVLAYNTHLNGLTANFALNESFLNTAQLRSSVVSHAEMLGYVPLSVTSARAFLNLSVIISDPNRPTNITLPRGTSFSATASGVSYTFRTLEAYTGLDNGSGVYEFKTSTADTSIPVYEGEERTKTFLVGEKLEQAVYVIPDTTMDTSSLFVRVFDTSSSSTFETYTNVNTAIRIDEDSKHYQIKEVPNGNYEIIFSDGFTIGKAPTAGNKIVISYLSSSGELANSAEVFTATADVAVNGDDYPLTVTTEAASADGSQKEELESIRTNAPLLFLSQQRLVTAQDYTAQILANYNYVLDDVVSWGGEENDPPEYGEVYVGLKFKDDTSSIVQETIKGEIITRLTDNMAIMSIDTKYVDPVETLLEVETIFNFDPDLTTSTAKATENLVFSTVKTYFTDNLGKFDKVFRRSNLLSLIDDLDESILNTKINVKLQQKFAPVTGQSNTYKQSFPVAIATADDEFHRVTSSRFTFNSRICFIRNKLSSTKLQIINADGGVEIDNIGTYTPDTGVVQLEGFNPTSVEGGSDIKLSVVPANQSTVRPLRNYILKLDDQLSTALAQIDYQNTQTTL